MDAGTTDFQKAPGQAENPGHVELGLRIEAARVRKRAIAEHTRRADNLAGAVVPHRQMPAHRVETILVQAVGVQSDAELTGEHLEAQAVAGPDLSVGLSKRNRQRSWLDWVPGCL